MESRWSEREAAEFVERLAPRWSEDMALRVYTSRLIGRDPDLVMHGGGNTSLKGTVTTLVGDRVEALFVKGSGWDLDAIEPPGLPAVDLAHLRRLRGLDALSDEEMVNQLRTHLFDAGAPNPSVETLLHAFLPHRFIDHTHADIALVVTNQPAAEQEALVSEAFGARWAVVPYVMPGFALAKLAAEVYERDAAVEGLVLLNHGLFTFADDARTAYERMIAGVDRAERLVARRARSDRRVSASMSIDLGRAQAAAARLAPVLRSALAEPSGDADRPWRRMVLEYRASDDGLALLARSDAAALALENPLTPDHVIRTKGRALMLEPPLPLDDDAALRERVFAGVRHFREAYDAYFEANAARARTRITKLDATPRVILVPGVGLFAAGRTKHDARIAADIAEHTVRAKALANDVGRYRGLGDPDLFDMEYWVLEQAKLGTAKDAPLAGQVALVTGAAGAIGFGIARQLVAAGAHVVLTDIDRERLDTACGQIDPKDRGLVAGIVMDVTDEESVAAGLADTCRLYGGLDLLVLNAGVAHVSAIEELDPAALRRVIEVNLVGYFLVLREGARLLRRQGTGGNVVVNSSKNVFAPGADFGAYSASKAGAHQLAKVAALELAGAGVRVNMINADAVFGDPSRPSGLWQEVGPSRARSRGLDPAALQDYYRQRNLLHARVTPEHIGNAVVFLASNLTPTTGATIPVDGGVADAFPRSELMMGDVRWICLDADDLMHENTGESNYNESAYYNFYDPAQRLGGFVRIGNRPNEGYAETTLCLYLPDGTVGFMFGRPKIPDNAHFDAGGMRFEVRSPMREHHIAYEGNVCMLARPLDLLDPRAAFTQNPHVPARVELSYTALSPVHGGELREERDGRWESLRVERAGQEFARGHLEQHGHAVGRVSVGERSWSIDGFGLRDRSWGPRYWQAPSYYRWLTMNFGGGAGIAAALTVQRDGRQVQGGYVWEAGSPNRPLGRIEVESHHAGAEQLHWGLRARLHAADGSGVEEVTGRVLAMVPLRNRRGGVTTRIAEGLTEWQWRGRVGYGWSEFLDHVD